jgi:hypothetical protein
VKAMRVVVAIVVLLAGGRGVRLSASAPHVSRSGATARPSRSAKREGWQADHESPANRLRHGYGGQEAGRHDDLGTALNLRATVANPASGGALTITLSRWSAEAERAPLMAALAAPRPAARPAGSAPPAGAAGRGRGRGAPPPPPSLFARLSAAVKAAPTLGYIWTDGVTGYSIKYAWRAPASDDKERIVLVTDRRLNSHTADWAPASGAAADADFTVIEMRIDRQGAGEGKTSLTTGVAIDTEAKTLALEGYAAAPAWLKVTR